MKIDGDRPTEPLIDLKDLAEWLHVSRGMAWKLVNTGAIDSVRVGNSVRLYPQDVRRYLADQRRRDK